MRISDWSSDVCSSDLCAKSDKEGEPMMFRFVVAALIACAISNAHAAPPSVAAPAAVAATDSAALPGDPARGRKVFFQCRTCHYPAKAYGNHNGPKLYGVFGRKRSDARGGGNECVSTGRTPGGADT